MKSIHIPILILITASAVMAQTSDKRLAVNAMQLVQGYVTESIGGQGIGGCTGVPVYNIPAGNPAAIRNFDRIIAGISWQFESGIQPAWIEGIGYERLYPALPQSFGVVIPAGRFRVGLGMSQSYNGRMDMAPMEVTTVSQPEGTGETFTASSSDLLIRYSVLMSCKLGHGARYDHGWSTGITCSYNRLNIEDKIFHSSMKAATGDFGWTFGLHYRDADRFQAGVFYEWNPAFEDVVQYDGPDMMIQTDPDPTVAGNNQAVNAALTTTCYLDSKFPDRLHIGFACRPVPVFGLSFDLAHVYWNQVSDQYKSHIDLAGNVTADIIPALALTIGFLSTDRRTGGDLDRYFDVNGKLSAFFLLTGIRIRLPGFYLDAAYVTNINDSAVWRDQHIFKTGIGVKF
ncbi:hypothetical protein JW948_09515 [bacterium]|nr:hypothetical protein [bacterium]